MGATSETLVTTTSTGDCLNLMANIKVDCLSFLGGSFAAGPECFSGVTASAIDEIFGGTDCRCNPAVQASLPVSVVEAITTGCGERKTYTYGCEESDQSIDLARYNQLKRFT